MTSYDWWQRALAGEKIGGPTLPIHDGDSHLGFFRKRKEARGSFVGVAIFEHEGKIVALVDKRVMDAAEAFSWGARYPVTEEAYRQWDETGKWPDEDSAVAESLAPPPTGHNNPPVEDPAAEIQRKIDAVSANAKDYEKIEDQVAADKAQSVRSRLLELMGEAEKAHEVEKRPILDQSRAIDKKWLTPAKAAKAAADKIREALSAFATAQRKKAEAAAAEAEKAASARIPAEEEAAKAAAKAAAKGKPAPAPLPPPPEPVAAPVVPAQIGGAYGRRASVRTIKVATVVDQDKAYLAMKAHPELKELIAKLAQRAVDKGVEVDGVTHEEREDVR